MDWKLSADVIVVGAGYSGLRAAIAAHDSESKVLVLEKLDHPGGISVMGTADKAADFMGCKSPAVNCPVRTASISGTRGGNKPWYVRR